MRENRPYGSEGGAARKGRPYPYPGTPPREPISDRLLEAMTDNSRSLPRSAGHHSCLDARVMASVAIDVSVGATACARPSTATRSPAVVHLRLSRCDFPPTAPDLNQF
jgi:hypothetical protein